MKLTHLRNTVWPLAALAALACGDSAEPPANGLPVQGAPGAVGAPAAGASGMPGAAGTAAPAGSAVPGAPGVATPGVATPGGGTPVAGTATPGTPTAPVSPGEVPDEAELPTVPAECAQTITPGRAPIRRMTRFEYNNTVEELLLDSTSPATPLPPELLGNGFGNDADQQPVSEYLAAQYGDVAESISIRAVGNPEVLNRYAPCAATVTEATEAACAQTFIENYVPKVYRRNLEAGESEDLMALFNAIRPDSTFTDSLAGIMEATLQAPEFLYRVELGEPDPANAGVRRPTGHELASRLSYMLWGSMPDDTLSAAADAGELATPQGVLTQASRMLADERSRPLFRFFFDSYLPINTLGELQREAEQFPTYSNAIGNLMHEETQTFLDYEIFEGSGSWAAALTAPYTFVNEELANFYGFTGVTGPEFQRVDLDTTHRMGLLTQGGIMAGTTISNFTNPVRRGGYLLKHIMCVPVPPPPAEFAGLAKPPDPYSGDTGRERYSAHSVQPECAGCHAVLDPPGFALENYDAVGLWRDTENDKVIDASGDLAATGPFNGPIELVQKIAALPDTYACFADHWMTFGYGRPLEAEDECSEAEVRRSFAESGYNIQQLLLSMTQTDAFLYLPQEAL